MAWLVVCESANTEMLQFTGTNQRIRRDLVNQEMIIRIVMAYNQGSLDYLPEKFTKDLVDIY